jgi:hypothetical protein
MGKKKEMTIGEACRTILRESRDALLNTIFNFDDFRVDEKEEKKPTVKMGKIPYDGMMKEKPKRARGKKGKFLADDKSTKDYNEAYVGGKAPKKKRKK